jgi:hypothetical protein
VVPGVILVCAAFGSSTTAVVVSEDMKAGIVDRFRSLDIGGAVMVTGHVVASVARNLVATDAGVRSGPGGRVPSPRLGAAMARGVRGSWCCS